MATKPGYVRVSFEYSRSVSARCIHGAVTLQFTPAEAFHFVSEATWPAGEDYVSTVEAAVRVTLEEKGTLNQTACKLLRLGWDEIYSCEVGFRNAARAATLSAFDV